MEIRIREYYNKIRLRREEDRNKKRGRWEKKCGRRE